MIKAIAILLPIAMAIVAFVKKIFKLDGWAARTVSLLVAGVMAIGYGVMEGLIWYYILALALGLWVSASGAYDWLKEFVGWLGQGLGNRRT